MIRLTILGEPASKANSREIVTFPMKCVKCPSCSAAASVSDKLCGKCGAPFVRPAVIKSKKAREYERDALRQITGVHRVMFTGPLRVTIRIFYATERPDLDESVILDVLQAKYSPAKEGPRELVRAGVYVNDRQVREKHVYHGIDRASPRAEIEVEPLEAALFEALPPPPVKPRAPARSARPAPALSTDGNPF